LKAVAAFIENHASVQPPSAIRYQGIMGATVVGTYAPLKMPDWAVVTELPWEEAYQEIVEGVVTAVGITLAMAFFAGIFGTFVAKRLAVPVINLTETASRIAAGERDLQAAVGGPREVARLAIAFNSMTTQLRQSLKDVEQRFADLKRTEEALRLSEERLRLALEGTSDGIWDWNLQTGQAYFSPRYYTMIGYEPNEFPATYESWRQLLHPSDVEPSESAVQRAIAEHSLFAIEFRFKAKNGEWRWILGRGKVAESDMAGKAVRVVGSHTDITERKRAEMALQQSEQKFRVLVESAQPIIFIVDENGVFQLSEGQGLAKLGLQPGQVVGQSAFEVYKDVPSVLEGVRMALDGKTNRTVNVVNDVVFDTVFSPYFTPDGRQNGVFGIAIDITARTAGRSVPRVLLV
jgi:PAS domain S-box-containing protein